MLKFNKKISDYQYILSFDLAKRVSGYSLLDFKDNTVLLTGVIDTNKSRAENVWSYFYSGVLSAIDKSIEIVGEYNQNLIFITKEKLPNQGGSFSTIETLQGLAQAHAIFDLAVSHSGIDVYDYDGVHSVSVKSVFKKLTDIDKPQKEDIAEYLKNKYKDYNFGNSLDITDSLAVSITLLNKKWNADISDRIKEIKKELAEAKSKQKIKKLQDEINKLEELKIIK